MKKIIVAIVALIILTISVTASPSNDQNNDIELYQDAIMTTLSPIIIPTIDNYYKRIYKYPPNIDLVGMTLKKIERPNGHRTGYFLINLEVIPYFGPHVSIGKDSLTIELDFYNNPKVVNFKHLESYHLPENYNNFYVTN